MPLKADILARFSGAGRDHPFYLPDLTLWYEWHKSKGTLPDAWKDFSLTLWGGIPQDFKNFFKTWAFDLTIRDDYLRVEVLGQALSWNTR